MLEYGVEDTTADTNGSAGFGQFPNSFVSGRITINGTLIELEGSSITGQTLLEDLSNVAQDGDRF